MIDHQRSFAEVSPSDTPNTNSSSPRSGPSASRAFLSLTQSTMDQNRQADLTAEALERLQISNEANSNSEAISSARSAIRDGILRRQPSQTPSVTSVSTGPEDGDSRDRSRSRPSSRQTERYMKDQVGDKGKGKGKVVEHSGTTISDLPGEVLISVRPHGSMEEGVLILDIQSFDD
jgi:hypothetical protein